MMASALSEICAHLALDITGPIPWARGVGILRSLLLCSRWAKLGNLTRFGGPSLRFGVRVSVDVERHGRVGMSQRATDGFHVHAFGNPHGGIGVPQLIFLMNSFCGRQAFLAWCYLGKRELYLVSYLGTWTRQLLE